MVRAQIQLPDHLFQRAKEFCRGRELSLAELCRRSLEEYLAHFPAPSPSRWELPPALDLGDFLAPPERWRELANESA